MLSATAIDRLSVFAKSITASEMWSLQLITCSSYCRPAGIVVQHVFISSNTFHIFDNMTLLLLSSYQSPVSLYKTSGQSNWTIRSHRHCTWMVHSYLPSGTSVHICLIHIIFFKIYILPWTHQTQHLKRHLDRSAVFLQLTAEGPYTLQWAPLPPLKIASSHRDLNSI